MAGFKCEQRDHRDDRPLATRLMRIALLCSLPLSIMACGGGGGSSNGNAAVDSASAYTLAVTELNQSGAVGDGFAFADMGMQFAGLGETAFYSLSDSGQNVLNFNCSGSGAIHVARLNAIATTPIGVGDQIDVTYTQCISASGAQLDAQVSLKVTAFTVVNGTEQLGYQVSVGSYAVMAGTQTTLITGDVSVLSRHSINADEYSITGGKFSVNSGRASVQDLAATWSQQYGTGNYSLAFSGAAADSGLGGSFRFATESPLMGALNSWPSAGSVLVTGSGVTSARLSQGAARPGFSQYNFASLQAYSGGVATGTAQFIAWSDLLPTDYVTPINPSATFPTAPIRLIPSQSAIAVTADTASANQDISTSIYLEVAGGKAPFYINYSYSHNAINGNSVVPQLIPAGTIGSILYVVPVAFVRPSLLGAAIYHDTVTITACADSACNDPIPGASLVIPVTFTVTGNPNSSEDLSISTQPWIIEASSDPAAQATSVRYFSYSPSLPYPVHLVTSFADNGPVSAASVTDEIYNKQVQVTMKSASLYAPGTYAGSMQVSACIDTACTRQLAGSPVMIPIKYVVPAIKGRDYSQLSLPINVASMTWNPLTQRLWVAPRVLTYAGQATLVEINPTTASVVRTLPIDKDVTVLATTTDGTRMYVYVSDFSTISEIRRYRVSDMTVEAVIPFATNERVVSMVPAPGSNQTLVIGKLTNGLQPTSVIFDDTTPRSGVRTSVLFEQEQQWGDDAATLFITESQSAINSLLRFHPTISGLGAPASAQTLASPTQMFGSLSYQASQLISASGTVFNTSTNTVEGTFPLGTPLTDFGVTYDDVTVDWANRRIFFTYTDKALDYWKFTLQSFDTITRQPLAYIRLDGSAWAASIVRYGTNGLALTYGDKLLLISGTFVVP